MDMLQLQRRMDAIPDEEVKAEAKRVSKDWEYPLGEPEPEVIEKAVRMYMGTVALCQEKNFDTFSYKCVDGVDLEMGLTHAIPSSLVANAGYPYVDENDLGNSVSQLMLKWISGKQVTFLEHYEHHPEWIILGEDGYVLPTSSRETQIKYISTVLERNCQLLQYEKGQDDLHASPKQMKGINAHCHRRGKRETKMGRNGRAAPPGQASLYPDACKANSITQSQHFAAAYGSYVDELVDLCAVGY